MSSRLLRKGSKGGVADAEPRSPRGMAAIRARAQATEDKYKSRLKAWAEEFYYEKHLMKLFVALCLPKEQKPEA